MKIDLKQLTQDKKNLPIIAGLLAVILVVAVVFILRGSSGGSGGTAAGTDPAAGDMAAAGMEAGDPAASPEAGGMPGPGDPAMGDPGMGDPALEGGDEMAAAEGAPAADGAATTFPKGEPVEPFRTDPFVPITNERPVPRLPVMPPVVIAIQPPDPMPIPATVNVIPASVQPDKVAGEVRRRLSGVLWNGRVVAILESPDQQRADIVRPGDRIPDLNLFVKSITRDHMVVIDERVGPEQEIVVDLRALPRAAAPQMGMGMAPGMEPGMPGMP